jgi:sugar O-acyltransferase (sialic acid O-acetyltransferase NeuD family)
MNRIVVVPELGVNDTFAIVTELRARGLAPVTEGDVIATLETTKVSLEVTAPASGFLAWFAEEGSRVPVQGEIAAICPTSNEAEKRASERRDARLAQHLGTAMTNGARRLANEHGLTEADFVHLSSAVVREIDVRRLLMNRLSSETVSDGAHDRVDASRIAIFNAGPGGRTVAQTARAAGIDVAMYIDDEISKDGRLVDGVPVHSLDDFIASYLGSVDAVFVHLQKEAKARIVERLADEGMRAPTIIHPSAFVDPTARLSEGAIVKAGAIIDAFVSVGAHSIVDNGAILPHDVSVGSFTHIAPGATMGGGARIGSRVVLGIGACISTQIAVGDDAIVLPGAVVKRDVEPGAIIDDGDRIVGRAKKS